MTRRIIQFSTGNVGVHALRTVIERPDFELVGVHAADPGKVGRDAAELCGLDAPTGVIATDDIESLVALDADCMVYTSQAETRPMAAMEDIARFLRAGTNVVGSSFVWLVAPDYTDDWLRGPLEKACQEGNSTLYINGIDPGFSGDTLVYTALSLAAHATAVTVQEICDYGSYDDAEFTGVSFGFGSDPEHEPILFAPGVLASMWGAPSTQPRSRSRSGAGRGARTPRKVGDSRTHSVHHDGRRGGQVAAVRFGVEGIRDGKTVITMEHVNRLTEIAAPDWAYPPDGRPGVHRVVVEGRSRGRDQHPRRQIGHGP